MEIFLQEIQDHLKSTQTTPTIYRECIETLQKYLFIANPSFFSLKRDQFDAFGDILTGCLNKFYGGHQVNENNRLLLRQLADLTLKIDLNCGDETFCAKMMETVNGNLLSLISREAGQEMVKDALDQELKNTQKVNLTQKQFGKCILVDL